MVRIATATTTIGCLLLCGMAGFLGSCSDSNGGTLVLTPEPSPTPTSLPTSTPGPDPNPPGGGPPEIEITSPAAVFVPYIVVRGNELSVTTGILAPAGLSDTIVVDVGGPISFTNTLTPEDIGCVTGSTVLCNSTRVAVLPENSPAGNYATQVTVSDQLDQEAFTTFPVEVVEAGTSPPLVEITDPPEPITIPALGPLTFSASILAPDGLGQSFTIFLQGNSSETNFVSLSIEVPVGEVNCQPGSIEICFARFTDLFPGQIPAGDNYTLTVQAVDQLDNLGSDQVTLVAQ